MKLLIVNGPNINLTGTREPDVYGTRTLAQINAEVEKTAGRAGVQCEFFQSNSEGGLIDFLQSRIGQADGIIINKADGDNIDKANLAAAQFRNALHLFPPSESGWFPKVLTYSGYYNIGIKEIWDMVGEYMEFTKKNGYFNYKRNEQAKYWMYESINEALRNSFYQNPRIEAALQQYRQEVLEDRLSSFVAAKRLLDMYFEKR